MSKMCCEKKGQLCSIHRDVHVLVASLHENYPDVVSDSTICIGTPVPFKVYYCWV